MVSSAASLSALHQHGATLDYVRAGYFQDLTAFDPQDLARLDCDLESLELYVKSEKDLLLVRKLRDNAASAYHAQ